MNADSSPFTLEGKTALVTGARRGIGRAIALGLARAGADIIGVSVSADGAKDEAATQIRAVGRRVDWFSCDLADPTDVEALLARVHDESPPVDILFNNAGTIFRAPAVEHPDEAWARILQVNLTSQFALARNLGARMLERGSGKIVFTASLLSFQGGILVPSYAAAKGGIAQLTKALANEWAAGGVNVNAIAPGYIRTDNTQELQNDPVREPTIVERIPAGRWVRRTT